MLAEAVGIIGAIAAIAAAILSAIGNVMNKWMNAPELTIEHIQPLRNNWFKVELVVHAGSYPVILKKLTSNALVMKEETIDLFQRCGSLEAVAEEGGSSVQLNFSLPSNKRRGCAVGFTLLIKLDSKQTDFLICLAISNSLFAIKHRVKIQANNVTA